MRKCPHGDYKKLLYRTWITMRSRCRNPKTTGYKYYGGKGITVCPEWDNYLVFKKWALENGYQEHLTIERLDNNLNYCPSNCTWITQSEQSKHTSNNKYITIDGVAQTIQEWVNQLKLGSRHGIANARKQGWTTTEYLTWKYQNPNGLWLATRDKP